MENTVKCYECGLEVTLPEDSFNSLKEMIEKVGDVKFVCEKCGPELCPLEVE